MMSSFPFSLYVHIPFCVKKCPYCDFNSYEGRFEEERYMAAVETELRYYASRAEWGGRECRTVFFGGGTPSLLSASSVERFLGRLVDLFPVADGAEITLEANPGTVREEVGYERLCGYRAAGVNRLSFGAQSFSERKLALLGRIHVPDDTRRAVSFAADAGFDNFNLDLMFGVSGETSDEWRGDLEQAVSLFPTHISAYGLTIEPGTEFGRRQRRGELLTASEELQTEAYEYTGAFLEARGSPRYEISNYARPGFECRHNLNYWRRGSYLGLGAGAHSFLREEGFGVRWSNIPGPTHYIERVEGGRTAVQLSEKLVECQAELEFFSLGLRTAAGVSGSEFFAGFRRRWRQSGILSDLGEEGLLTCDGDRVHLSSKGFLFANTVFERLAEI